MPKFIFRVSPNATSEDHEICFDIRRFQYNLSIQLHLSYYGLSGKYLKHNSIILFEIFGADDQHANFI